MWQSTLIQLNIYSVSQKWLHFNSSKLALSGELGPVTKSVHRDTGCPEKNYTLFSHLTSKRNHSETVCQNHLKFDVRRVPIRNSSHMKFQVILINHFLVIPFGSQVRKKVCNFFLDTLYVVLEGLYELYIQCVTISILTISKLRSVWESAGKNNRLLAAAINSGDIVSGGGRK